MKHNARIPGSGGKRPAGRRSAKNKKTTTHPKDAGRRSATKGLEALLDGKLPADMLRLKNGRNVRKGEFVVFVRLRKGGSGVYILSEDLIYLPADEIIGEVEIERGISLDSPLVMHPEME